ncbi:MAG: hypothetical protein AABY22_27755 [Nanoarchaeota archaeon]
MKCKNCECRLYLIDGEFTHSVGHLSFCKKRCTKPEPETEADSTNPEPEK